MTEKNTSYPEADRGLEVNERKPQADKANLKEDKRHKNAISDETMEYVGILAKLELSEAEAEAAKGDMEEMLDYIDKLDELETDGIEPKSHIFPLCNVFREDVVSENDEREAILKNAPDEKCGGFKVPKTIGE